MKFSVAQCAILVAAFGMTAAAAPAQAMDDRAEIQALLARVKALEAKVAKQDAAARKSKAGEAPTLFVKGPAPEPVAEDSFHFKGLTLTPGGFIALETVRRSNWVGADINTNYANIPFPFQPSYHTDEFRFSGRQSRLSLKTTGDLDPLNHITGFVETDFLGAAQTANSNQSNSYNLRLRQIWWNVDNDPWGLHFLAGQTWSLAATNSVGIKPETYLLPPTIDAQYLPGFFWSRQPGIRVTKDFNKEFWIAVSAEGSAQTWAGTPNLLAYPNGWSAAGTPIAQLTTNAALWPVGYAGPYVAGVPQGGGLFNAANNYTFNRMPDIIGKAAWDSHWLPDRKLHIEGFGIVRDFTDRSLWGNQHVWGGGGGGTVLVEIMPKLLDFQASGVIGRGIGRYGVLNDAAISISGAPLPISERFLMVGATLHPTSQTDVYGFYGGEFQNKSAQYYGANVGGITRLVAGGYGSPFYSNWGCYAENEFAAAAANVSPTAPFAGTSCSGNTKDVRQVTGGIWHTFYHGPAGKIKVGFQYSYTKRDGFWSFMGGAPSTHDNMVYTSFRYYPFD